MKQGSTLLYSLLAIMVGSLIGCSPGPVGADSKNPATAERPRLALAYFPNVTHAPALLGVADKVFEKHLPDYRMEYRVVNAGPEAMEALLAGALDATYVGPSPAINTFIRSNGEAVRVITGVCSGGASLMAREGSNIRTIQDLAGRRIAVPQLGGTQDVSARHFLAKEGLRTKDRGGNVEILPIKNPDILTLFLKGDLDAAWVPEPWATRLEIEAKASRVIDERDLWPNREFTTTVLVVSTEFAVNHPDAVEALIKANDEALQLIADDPARAKTVVNAELRRLTGKALPQDVLESSWDRVSFTSDPHRSTMDTFAQAAKDLGYLRGDLISLDKLFQVPGSRP